MGRERDKSMDSITKERYDFCLQWFSKNMPKAESELKYENPFQLLVAVILSAQCTDKRVNEVTPSLFLAFPSAKEMSQSSVEEIFRYIHSISYPNNKAKHLKGMSVGLMERFQGEVPQTMEELVSLPGVGRKTANVILAVAFGKPAMAVDTHIFRVSNRLGLTKNSKNPLQTELTLLKNIPSNLLPKAHHWLLLHGRYVCTARKPHCEECGLSKVCCSFSKKA
ncbi:MAG TPA: endonuclease III [Porphyromonadaceae bacterium]|nr:endonuclease III [Porphyromonadaceae bacterium]